MRFQHDAAQDVRTVLETVGLECEATLSDPQNDVNAIKRQSEAARRSDVYRRSLARACLSELRHRKVV